MRPTSNYLVNSSSPRTNAGTMKRGCTLCASSASSRHNASSFLNTLRTIEETNAMHLPETIDKAAFKDAKILHINIIFYDDMLMLDNKDIYPLKDLS